MPKFDEVKGMIPEEELDSGSRSYQAVVDENKRLGATVRELKKQVEALEARADESERNHRQVEGELMAAKESFDASDKARKQAEAQRDKLYQQLYGINAMWVDDKRLTDDVIIEIFNKMSLGERFTLELVSKRWCRVSRQVPIKRINFSRYIPWVATWEWHHGVLSMSQSIWMTGVLSRYGHTLTTLLMPYYITHDICEAISCYCPLLSSLTIGVMDIEDVIAFKNLSYLSVCRFDPILEDSLTPELMDCITGLCELHIVDISKDSLEMLGRHAGGALPSLKCLGSCSPAFVSTNYPNLDMVHLTLGSGYTELQFVNSFPRLKGLSFRCAQNTYLVLPPDLPNRLEALFLNNISNSSTNYRCLENLPNLRRLSLIHCFGFSINTLFRISDEARLESLLLSPCHDAHAVIAWVVERQFNLIELGLRHSRVMAIEVKEVLQECPSLKSLDLSRSKTVSGDILDIISEDGKNLRHLDVRGTRCRWDHVVEFMFRRMNCQTIPFLFLLFGDGKFTISSFIRRANMYLLSSKFVTDAMLWRKDDFFDFDNC